VVLAEMADIPHYTDFHRAELMEPVQVAVVEVLVDQV
jgi:hypothetical protein